MILRAQSIQAYRTAKSTHSLALCVATFYVGCFAAIVMWGVGSGDKHLQRKLALSHSMRIQVAQLLSR